LIKKTNNKLEKLEKELIENKEDLLKANNLLISGNRNIFNYLII
jgi:hypothetical protein